MCPAGTLPIACCEKEILHNAAWRICFRVGAHAVHANCSVKCVCVWEKVGARFMRQDHGWEATHKHTFSTDTHIDVCADTSMHTKDAAGHWHHLWCAAHCLQVKGTFTTPVVLAVKPHNAKSAHIPSKCLLDNLFAQCSQAENV